ncbi:DegT/DnrJ/EryC1/StrS family aminotransferase [Bacillus pacificus]
MPSFTFPATPLAAIWCGLEPYFIDISIDDWYMDKTVLWDKIEELKRRGCDCCPVRNFWLMDELRRI